ncbi:hypothetical protein [Chitinophaga rhizosphaerae]|uniref:hypothetical protein n=1 Tax=Chitinophaga rhizosphaerae TaxID=1864947 RepID=UPI000F814617|nr:hypothetical protein [Chitinophaga rhizosphaerae]
MKRIFSQWSAGRWIRLGAGATIFIYSMLMREWPLAIFGGLFALMAVLNASPCASGNCRVPDNRTRR